MRKIRTLEIDADATSGNVEGGLVSRRSEEIEGNRRRTVRMLLMYEMEIRSEPFDGGGRRYLTRQLLTASCGRCPEDLFESLHRHMHSFDGLERYNLELRLSLQSFTG